MTPIELVHKTNLDELRKLCRFPMDRDTKINHVDGLIDLCNHVVTKDMTIVELGTYEGVSTAVFSHFAKFVTTYDLDMRIAPSLEGLSNVRRVQGDSCQAAQPYQDRSVDLVYLDTDHRYNQVMRELMAWTKKVKPGGYIAGHDFQADPGVEVIKAVCDRFDYPDRIYSDSSWIIRL